MALLKIKVLGKTFITWGTTRLTYIRNINTIQDTSISFLNGTGQNFTSGQVLFTLGTAGTAGFLQVRSKNNTTLTGNGIFELSVEHYPTSTAADYQQNYNIDTSPTSITFTYNSAPVISDIVVETPNNTPYIFLKSDFTSHFTDFDSDLIYEVQINGDVTGFLYDGVPYIAGTWIPISHIDAGRIEYVPINQSAYYEKDNTYKVKDSAGNISVN